MLSSFGRIAHPYLTVCRTLKPTFALRPSSPRRSILLSVPSLVRTRADFAPTRKGTSSSSVQDANEAESTNVAHSRFLAEASPRQKWSNDGADGPAEEAEEDLHDLPDGQGTHIAHAYVFLLRHVLIACSLCRKALADFLPPLQAHHSPGLSHFHLQHIVIFITAS
jgi:hypothetical protein